MTARSQPYRLLFPLTPEQVESIDEMFQLLFDDVGNDSIFPEKTANTVLHVNADGETLEFEQVDLTADVQNTLPIANGGTNTTSTPTAGAVAYGTGTALAWNAAGTTGQALLSGGTGAPTWGTAGVQAAMVMTRVVLGI